MASRGPGIAPARSCAFEATVSPSAQGNPNYEKSAHKLVFKEAAEAWKQLSEREKEEQMQKARVRASAGGALQALWPCDTTRRAASRRGVGVPRSSRRSTTTRLRCTRWATSATRRCPRTGRATTTTRTTSRRRSPSRRSRSRRGRERAGRGAGRAQGRGARDGRHGVGDAQGAAVLGPVKAAKKADAHGDAMHVQKKKKARL